MRRSNEAAGSTSAYLIGRWGSSAFMLSTTAVVDVARGLVLLYGIGTSALPSWDPRMGRSNLMGGLAGSGRQAKRTCELTSSIVPRGTPFHRRVELEFPPIAIGLEQLSCRCCIPGPAEFSSVNPDAVQDHGQTACQCDDGPFYAAPLGDLHRPGLCRTHQHALGCLVEHGPHHLVPAARYGAWAVSFTRLMPGARQSEHRSNRLGFAEAGGHIDGGTIGQRHHRPDARHRHQAPAHLVVPDHSKHAPAAPTMPTLRPKLRRVPRRSLSTAMAFDCKSLRWVSSIRSF